MNEPRILVREARLEEARRLFAWRNDPSTRDMFLDSGEVGDLLPEAG